MCNVGDSGEMKCAKYSSSDRAFFVANLHWHNSSHSINMTSNGDIRRMLSLYAELLQLHGQDPKLAASLSSGAYYIRRISEEIISLSKEEIARLFRLPLRKIIEELKASGTIAALDELIQLTPGGLFEMMRIKGLGGKKLGVLWHTAKIDTLEGLLKAAKSDLIASIPGFGKKTQANIITAIESYTVSHNHFRYGSIGRVADNLVHRIKEFSKSEMVSLCGDIRRCANTVPEIEIVSAIPAKKFTDSSLKKWMIIKKSTATQSTGITPDEIPVIIYHTTKQKYPERLFKLTGNEVHVKKVLERIKAKKVFVSEEDIYKKAKLSFIAPEMREDTAEWDFNYNAKDLITMEDIKGVVHNHTTWSDGVDTLEDFCMACRKKGFEYTVISDHSKNAHYAGGLKEDKVLRQFKAIDSLNRQLAPFHIFKSIECDIRVNGDLDFEPSLLKKFDLVIVSIHQLLKMAEAKATARLIRAIENEYTTIVGHMSGRLLLSRPGYPVNYTKVIDACAANDVIIEVNANPYRLDMDWSHIPYALKKGVMISINPDAHSIKEIDNIRWGIAAARKGGLTKDRTWNALGLKQIRQWLKK
jgi:DNA polymerase (family 10)